MFVINDDYIPKIAAANYQKVTTSFSFTVNISFDKK